MISRTDIQKVSDLPIEQVAEALGLTVRKHWSLCPFHADSKPSLYFRVGKNKYRCFVCDHFGGPIDLAMEILSLNFRDAVCWLAQTFGIFIEDENKRTFQNVKPREVKPSLTPNPSSLTFNPSPLTPEHLAQMVAEPVLTDEAKAFLFDERKLDPRVISWCGISSTHTHLLIPYFDIDGKFVSVQWRSLTPNPSPLTSHLSPLTPHLSPLTHHLSPLTQIPLSQRQSVPHLQPTDTAYAEKGRTALHHRRLFRLLGDAQCRLQSHRNSICHLIEGARFGTPHPVIVISLS